MVCGDRFVCVALHNRLYIKPMYNVCVCVCVWFGMQFIRVRYVARVCANYTSIQCTTCVCVYVWFGMQSVHARYVARVCANSNKQCKHLASNSYDRTKTTPPFTAYSSKSSCFASENTAVIPNSRPRGPLLPSWPSSGECNTDSRARRLLHVLGVLWFLCADLMPVPEAVVVFARSGSGHDTPASSGFLPSCPCCKRWGSRHPGSDPGGLAVERCSAACTALSLSSFPAPANSHTCSLLSCARVGGGVDWCCGDKVLCEWERTGWAFVCPSLARSVSPRPFLASMASLCACLPPSGPTVLVHTRTMYQMPTPTIADRRKREEAREIWLHVPETVTVIGLTGIRLEVDRLWW